MGREYKHIWTQRSVWGSFPKKKNVQISLYGTDVCCRIVYPYPYSLSTDLKVYTIGFLLYPLTLNDFSGLRSSLDLQTVQARSLVFFSSKTASKSELNATGMQ